MARHRYCEVCNQPENVTEKVAGIRLTDFCKHHRMHMDCFLKVQESAGVIRALDKSIRANERELKRKAGKFDQGSAEAWQAAWDANPSLAAEEKRLYGERGEQQRLRSFIPA